MSGGCVLPLIGALCLTGCAFERTGPALHDSQSIDRDNSELVRVSLDMGAGTLRVTGGTDKLAAADFQYNVASWKPEVRYSSAAGYGSLIVRQPNGGASLGHTKYEWDLRLNRDVPLEIEAHLGAGEAHLDLGSLTLRNLEVEMGAGELDLDLRGTPKKRLRGSNPGWRRRSHHSPAVQCGRGSSSHRRNRRSQRAGPAPGRHPLCQRRLGERKGDHPPGRRGRRGVDPVDLVLSAHSALRRSAQDRAPGG